MWALASSAKKPGFTWILEKTRLSSQTKTISLPKCGQSRMKTQLSIFNAGLGPGLPEREHTTSEKREMTKMPNS